MTVEQKPLPYGGTVWSTRRGEIRVWQPEVGLILVQARQHGVGEFGKPIAAMIEAAAVRSAIEVYIDASQIGSYDSALRTDLTESFLKHRASVVIFSKSKIVQMGVAVARLALGSAIEDFSTQAKFCAHFDNALQRRGGKPFPIRNALESP